MSDFNLERPGNSVHMLVDTLRQRLAAAEERGRRAGWAEAIAVLRDQDRRDTWRLGHPGVVFHKGEADRFADYLTAAAPTDGSPTDGD